MLIISASKSHALVDSCFAIYSTFLWVCGPPRRSHFETSTTGSLRLARAECEAERLADQVRPLWHILHFLHVEDIYLNQKASSQIKQPEVRPRLRLEHFCLKPSQNDRPSTIAQLRNRDLRHQHASSLAPNVAAGVDRRRSAPLTRS